MLFTSRLRETNAVKQFIKNPIRTYRYSSNLFSHETSNSDKNKMDDTALVIVAAMVVIFLAVVSLMCARGLKAHKETATKNDVLEESIREAEETFEEQKNLEVASGNVD